MPKERAVTLLQELSKLAGESIDANAKLINELGLKEEISLLKEISMATILSTAEAGKRVGVRAGQL